MGAAKQRVLVTGASGFVGGAVVARLAADSRRVPVAGCRRSASVPEGVELAVTPSLGPEADWSSALQGVEALVHAAARVHVMDEPEADPLEAFRRVNVAGTLRLARQAVEAGVRRFVFVSSVKVNGEETSTGQPFREADAPAPEDPYGVSKREAEDGLRALSAETGLEVVIIRPPLVYGPGVGANFGSLLRWVHKGVPLPLGAVTQNRRSLVALDNLVDLIVTCLDHPAAAGETFLVADGEDVSTAGLLRKVGDALERPARLVPVPVALLRVGTAVLGRREMARRLLGSLQVDATKARTLLGWTPPVSLDEGLRRAVAPLHTTDTGRGA
ncbi:nucleoside-diphosphate-sugar epimerase [Thioalkalivibrio sp. ALE21]|uniref:UDP-glucose 4-epimerase family protein n=1 Tax=Thioalkalivibrio sp. ALE21 TaxID=1158175 RepID=UPI000D860CDF|nr:SDR family oxidoreductase [Thioalkalivibrio sp. ALE21]PYF99743.1 nucleoside-diphosphate-sugar epimerase [Thioalkalivibrio sp. ALE21]